MSVLNIYRDDGFVAEQVLMRASVSLGRHPENDIVLDDRTLSRFHARVERRGDRYVVIDLGAQNGVYLNGVRITGESGLTPGDRIGLGRYVAIFDPDGAEPHRARRAADDDSTNVLEKGKGVEVDLDGLDDGSLELHVDPVSSSAAPEPTRPLDSVPDGLDESTGEHKADDGLDIDIAGFSGEGPAFEEPTTAVVKKTRSSKEPPVLVLLLNGLEVSRKPVIDDELVIGRSKNCDVVISLLGLSRRHARVWREGGRIVVDDMGSQNGTWVNNQRIEGPRPLRHGDLLNFYEYSLVFLEDPNAQLDLPGVSFADGTDDSLASQETGRREPLTGRVIPSQVPTTRSPIPIADSEANSVPAEQPPLRPRSGDGSPGFSFEALGEGSYLQDEAFHADEGVGVSAEGPPTASELDALVAEDEIGSLPSEEEIDDELAEQLADELAGFAADTGTVTTAGKLQRNYDADKTAYSQVPRLNDDGGRGAWPSDEELEEALARRAGQRLMSLEVYLDGDLYTQMPIAQPVTRVGTDARCELALPSGAGLAKWQMTLVQLGATCVLYRASANARVIVDDVSIDQAVLKDGDAIQLGRVRLVYKCR